MVAQGNKITFQISGKFSGMNELINHNRTNKYIGAKAKKRETESVAWQIKVLRLKPITCSCKIHFEWHTTTNQDPDNLDGGGRKMLLDGFVKSGLLVNDTQRYIKGLSSVVVKDNSDYVNVTIEVLDC